MNSGKLADHVGDHVVLSPEGAILVTSSGTKSSYPRLPQSLNPSTMDQLIFTSLSHTHYWYEVGMLKVPAVVVVVVSHIQRIGCQPEKTTLHGGQSRSWSAEQGKENKIKSLAA